MREKQARVLRGDALVHASAVRGTPRHVEGRETLLKVTHDLCSRSRGYRPYSGSRAEIAAHMAARATGVRIDESPRSV